MDGDVIMQVLLAFLSVINSLILYILRDINARVKRLEDRVYAIIYDVGELQGSLSRLNDYVRRRR